MARLGATINRYLMRQSDVLLAFVMVLVSFPGMQVAENLSHFILALFLATFGLFFIGYAIVERVIGHRNMSCYESKK